MISGQIDGKMGTVITLLNLPPQKKVRVEPVHLAAPLRDFGETGDDFVLRFSVGVCVGCDSFWEFLVLMS